MNILIRNLSRDTTEKDIFSLFSDYGQVKSCNLVMDNKTGTSKGFGFAEMSNDKEAKAAIKGLNNKMVKGSRIRVKVSATRPPNSF